MACTLRHIYLQQGLHSLNLRRHFSSNFMLTNKLNKRTFALKFDKIGCDYCKSTHQNRHVSKLSGRTKSVEGKHDQKESLLDKKKRKEKKRLKMIERTSAKEEKMRQKKEQTAAFTYEKPTIPGEKKDVSDPLPIAYQPAYVEAAWYEWWEKMNYFAPSSSSMEQEKFIMCLPPPNVTGNLHLGHGLTIAVQDAIVRWHRMHGHQVLWNPGCDHAGIATQVVVEKKLWREQQKSRHDLGRETFTEEVWKWKIEKGNKIYEQMKRLGASLDWNRACFTMDEKVSQAVTEAFIRLHDEGLLYRSKRLVNWCCKLRSVISDIEVEYLPLSGRTNLEVPGYDKKVEFGTLISFAYPIVGSDKEVVVATTRIETMLGDTAVAINPCNPKYKELVGQYVQHPFCDRKIPIIADNTVDSAYGTGAVKITPAHDFNDYEIGIRHNLPFIEILNNDGVTTDVCQQFAGMKRFDARQEVLKALKGRNLYRGTTDNPMNVPICSRSNDIIEPRLKEQWFVDCKQMAEDALKAVENGELNLIPETYVSQWNEWLRNIRVWCVSRQLWWGHRIPAYKVENEGGSLEPIWISARSYDEALNKACDLTKIPKQELKLTQDEDVLDTWFSAALFPFAIFGWPDQTPDLKTFYPTSFLETGNDILFFWVARMVMLGRKLTGTLPFNEVLLHGILRDAYGRKMSKSLGNVIDPMDAINGISLEELNAQLDFSNLDQSEVKKACEGQKKDFPLGIPECGADALRFTLCSYNFKAQFINMDISHVKSYRNFCNKIWQSFRFTMKHLGDSYTPTGNAYNLHTNPPDGIIHQWILGRLSALLEDCDQHFKAHDLHFVTKALHQFWYSEFCDVYLECVKPLFSTSNDSTVFTDKNDHVLSQKLAARNTLYTCVHTALRATHPFMPYLTEELYQRLPKCEDTASSICVAQYPTASDNSLNQAGDIHSQMLIAQQLSQNILSLKSEMNIVKVHIPVYIQGFPGFHGDKPVEYLDIIKILSRSSKIHYNESVPDGCVCNDFLPKNIAIESSPLKIYLQLQNFVDVNNVLTWLSRRETKLMSSNNRDEDRNNAEFLLNEHDKIQSLIKAVQQISLL